MVFEATRLDVRGWVRNRSTAASKRCSTAHHRARGACCLARRGPGVALVTNMQVRAATADEIASIGSVFTRAPTAR